MPIRPLPCESPEAAAPEVAARGAAAPEAAAPEVAARGAAAPEVAARGAAVPEVAVPEVAVAAGGAGSLTPISSSRGVWCTCTVAVRERLCRITLVRASWIMRYPARLTAAGTGAAEPVRLRVTV